MKLSFDRFERYELPQVTLCNPNSRATEVDGKITITDTVGVLSNPKGMNLKLNFNAPHELSFDYYRHKSTDPIKQSFYDKIFEAIQTDRYVYLTDIGYFIISNVSDSDEENIDKKSISLKSCEENEFAVAEGLYLKEGTYYLHTNNNDGLLDLFLPKTAGWTMGYIDPSLLTKPYYVEDTEVDNGYNFLYTTVQNMFECIVEPDIIKRTISVYSRVYYAGHHLTDIHIAKYNLLKHRNIEENDEDKYTALNVQGKDENLEIRAVNPTGKNVIYNFEPRYAWMSPALQDAVTRWQKKCESVEDEYLTLQQGYYAELETLFNEEQNTEVLKGELKTLEETRDAVIITVGDQQSTALNNVNAQIAAKQEEINTATSNYNSHKNTVQANYEVPISQINSDCALDLTAKDINGNIIFTADLLNELMTHIKPTDYVDEYMLVTESMTYPQRFEKAKELMNRAKSQLVKISSGKKTYSVDTRSFLFNKHFKHFSEQLCAGAIIYVETKKDIMEQLHLTGIDINFDDKSTSFTLGNKYDRSDLKALYEDTLGQHSKSFSELKYIASIIEDQQKELDYQRNWVADLRTLTLDNVLTSEDQAIEINNRGLIGRKRQVNADGSWKEDKNGNPLFELEQVKLINNTLVFTEDNWNTASTAVGKIAVGYNSDGSVKYSYGINGQVLIGELILGNNLVLTGTGAGIKIKDSNGNNVFYADKNGNLNLTGNIVATSLDLVGCKINATNISGLSSVATSGNYGDLSDKPNIPTSVADLGLDTSKIIYKGDIEQKEKEDENGVLYKETIVPTASGSITYSTYDAGQYIIFGRELGTDKDGENYICISTEGLLKARNAFIYGTVYATDGEFTGKVIATSGKIGTWTLESNREGGSEYVLYGKGTGMSATTYSTDPAFWAGFTGNTTPWQQNDWADYCKFFVRNNGEMVAKAGTIGGWIINNNALYKDCKLNETKYRAYMQAPSDVTSTTSAFAVKETNKNGVDTWPFYVKYDGSMRATKGDIGGWTIGSSIIQKYANGYRSGMASTGGMDSVAFFAGTSNESGEVKDFSNFYVTHSGHLFVSKSTIQSILAPTSKISVFCSETDADNTTVGYGRFVYEQGGTIIYGGAEVIVKSKHDFIVDVHNGIQVINATDWNNETGAVQESFYVGRSGALMPGTEKNNNKQYAFKTTSIRGTNVRLYSHNKGGVYVGASGSTAVTSDENLKDLYPIDNRYEKFFMNLEPLLYKYKVGHRIHLGYGARAVERALTDAGLTTEEFAGILIDRDTNIGEDEVISPDGQTHFDELYSLRYEEFGALYAHMLKKSITRINHLENTVTELKTQLQTLTAG